jgi:hypothetical protein
MDLTNPQLVVECAVGILEPDPGILLRIVYATSRERLVNRQWDTAEYVIPLAKARELSQLFQKQIENADRQIH